MKQFSFDTFWIDRYLNYQAIFWLDVSGIFAIGKQLENIVVNCVFSHVYHTFNFNQL